MTSVKQLQEVSELQPAGRMQPSRVGSYILQSYVDIIFFD